MAASRPASRHDRNGEPAGRGAGAGPACPHAVCCGRCLPELPSSCGFFGTWRWQLFGKQFYVVNQLGAGSKSATGMVATSPADGYTLPVVGTGFAIAALVGVLP